MADALWPVPGSEAFNQRLLTSVITEWPSALCTVCIRGPCGSGKSHLVKQVLTSFPKHRNIRFARLTSFDIFRHEFSNGGTALPCRVAEICCNVAREHRDEGSNCVVVIVIEHAELFLSIDLHEDGRRTFAHAGFVMDLVTLQEDILVLGKGENQQRLVIILECTERWQSVAMDDATTLSGVLDLDASDVASLFDLSICIRAPVEEERTQFFANSLSMCSEPWRQELAAKTGGVLPRGLLEISQLSLELFQTMSHPREGARFQPSVDAVVAKYLNSGTHSCLMSRSSAGYADIQRTTWDDIVGLSEVKSQLTELLNAQVKNFASYRHHGVRPRAGVLLYGPPGTGKTMLARAMATELHASFVYLDLPQLIHAEVGESERVLDEFFAAARLRSPCVMFIDEIQAAFGMRDTGHQTNNPVAGSSHDARLVSFLLQKLDDARSDYQHTILFVGATNVVHLLDPGLLLPGRLDVQIHVPPPDRSTREVQIRRIFVSHWQSWSLGAECVEALVRNFVDMLDGATGAEISNCLNLFGLTVLDLLGGTQLEAGKIGELLWDGVSGSISAVTECAFDECRARLKRQ